MTSDSSANLNPELNDLWNRQESIMTIAEPTTLTNALRTAYRAEQRTLIWLNVQEITPSIVLAAMFAFAGIQIGSGGWAFFLAALLGLGVGTFLLITSLRQHRVETSFDTTMRGEIERALSQAQHRAWLYRNVFWWYLLPLLVAMGLILSVIRFDAGVTPGDLAFVVLVGGLGWYLFRANRRIASETYQPQVDRYHAMLQDLDRTDPNHR